MFLHRVENQNDGTENQQGGVENQRESLLELLDLESDISINDELKINKLNVNNITDKEINGGFDKEPNNKPNLFQVSNILVKKENKSVLKGGSDKPDLFVELKKGLFNLFISKH